MKKEVFEPIGDKLICLPVEQEQMSSGGIYLPDVDDKKSLKATVVAAGPGFYAGVSLFVGTTLKPGDTVLYQRFAAQVVDPVENIGAEIIKEVSMRAAKKAGDGTTTATVLAAAMYNEGAKAIINGLSPVEVKRGMDLAVSDLVTQIRAMAQDVVTNEEIKQIATISANNDEEVGEYR